MTVHGEPGGGVSIRVIIGIRDEAPGKHDLLELVIGAEHVADLSRALSCSAMTAADSDPPPFPCNIGFSRSAVSNVA